PRRRPAAGKDLGRRGRLGERLARPLTRSASGQTSSSNVIASVIRHRWLPLAALLALILQAAPAFAQPAATASPPASAPQQDPEAETVAAPVLLGGDPIIWIMAGAGPYTTQVRADRISERVKSIARDRSISNPTVTVTENEGSSELRAGTRLLMVVTQQDARAVGAARALLATEYARQLEAAIRSERMRYDPS